MQSESAMLMVEFTVPRVPLLPIQASCALQHAQDHVERSTMSTLELSLNFLQLGIRIGRDLNGFWHCLLWFCGLGLQLDRVMRTVNGTFTHQVYNLHEDGFLAELAIKQKARRTSLGVPSDL